MFHYKELIQLQNSDHAREITEADRVIQDAVDENMRGFLEDLKNSKIPAEKHDEIIQRVRRKLQTEAFNLFKKELKEESIQRESGVKSLSKLK